MCLPSPGQSVMGLSDALEQKAETVPYEKSLGRVSGEAVWAYPPGIPLILPGEKITQDFLSSVRDLEASGTALHHSRSQGIGIAVI